MRRLFQIAFISTAMISAAYTAPDIQLHGTRTQILTVPTSVNDSVGPKRLANEAKKVAPLNKSITILNIQLSNHAKQTIENSIEFANSPLANEDMNSLEVSRPAQVQLGMGNVPVLDQGRHGSCVTFAVTAAVDAVIQKGDYVSQLCQLQLGRYLEENTLSYTPGGWEGSSGRNVLGQISQFGIVNKTQEAAQGCGGLKAYPTDDETIPSSTLSLDQFHQMGENANSDIEWATVLDIDDAFREDLNRTEVLNKVKASLSTGDRLTFATLLFNTSAGVAGAVGSNHVKNDTWLFTPEMEHDFEKYTDFGFHEMVITGYDDQATAKDSNGRVHRGILTIRNSWGNRVADQGDFYMTYAYFKNFVVEAQRIGKITV